MPWIKVEDCTGCGDCVEACPVAAIVMVDELAVIDMGDCIRCGTCHDACPQGAVRHDGEKIPAEVDANVARALACMDACARHLGGEDERKKCLGRMIKHFTKEKTVAEKTLERLQSLKKELEAA
ncbi:MAG: 4Fe-4S binding protein [Desulfobacteraceae bacterium]|jgi:ferredoxin|nr:4Fe-4S binding protein [Desulfobacteraceae bacterium]